jgi:dipeptidyl aminopeptidase/acylaminoacyl peptidase
MYRILSICFLLSALALGITACEQAADTSSNIDDYAHLPMAAKPGAPAQANPAVVYLTASQQIGVMDANSNNQTIIYTSSQNWISNVSWSPTQTIVWSEIAGATSAIRAADVIVGSNGIPAASNVRTIISESSTPGQIALPKWSSTLTTGKIAYRVTSGSTMGNHLCLISPAGGSIDTIYTSPNGTSINCITWSPDDSKIAFFLIDGNTVNKVLVLDVATRNVVESIEITNFDQSTWIDDLEWSRTGSLNKLAFSINGTIYYLSPVTGSVPTTNGVQRLNSNFDGVACFSFSPDNSTLMFVNNRYSTRASDPPTVSLRSNKTQTATVSTINKTFPETSELNWHR